LSYLLYKSADCFPPRTSPEILGRKVAFLIPGAACDYFYVVTFINPAVDCLDCARHDARISANPNIVSNCDVDFVLVAGIARVRVNRMTRSINGNVGRDLNVVANFDFSHVKNNEVVVGEKPLSHFDVVAVVAVEGRLDVNPVASLSEDFFYKEVFSSIASGGRLLYL